MDALNEQFKIIKTAYDADRNPLAEIGALGEYCLGKIYNEASAHYRGDVGSKKYSVFQAGERISRPYLPPLLMNEPEKFHEAWENLLENVVQDSHYISLDIQVIDTVLYSLINSFCICYDLWKPASRKTPGTYFEVMMGSLLSVLLPSYRRRKFITLPGQTEKVSTDIVFEKTGEQGGLVFPVKITTRERIVQPFAHQRILDSVFGEGVYRSVLLCVSELQRAKNDGVNEICVPGTIKLFQIHLAHLNGIYYLDPPLRYCKSDISATIPVGSLGLFFQSKLAQLL